MSHPSMWLLPQVPYPATLKDAHVFGRCVSRHWSKPKFIGPRITDWQAYARGPGTAENVVRVLSCRYVHVHSPIGAHPRWQFPADLEADLSFWETSTLRTQHAPFGCSWAGSRLKPCTTLTGWNNLAHGEPFDWGNNPRWQLNAQRARAPLSAYRALACWNVLAPWTAPASRAPRSPSPLDQLIAWPAAMFIEPTATQADGAALTALYGAPAMWAYFAWMDAIDFWQLGANSLRVPSQ